MSGRMRLFVAVMLLVGIPVSIDAAVLCSNPSASVFVRTQCKKNEQQLNPVALGLVGPQGPVGPVGPAGPQGPQGLAGISGYEIVSSPATSVATLSSANVYVECPEGKKVLSGGFNIRMPDDVMVFSSEPSDGAGNLIDNRWNVLAYNAGALEGQITVSAICASVQ